MPTRMNFRILAPVFLLLAFAAIASAHNVTISYQAKIGNGPELKPGEYKIEVAKSPSTAEVLFYRRGDLVLRAPVTLAKETQKPQQTEVHYDGAEGARVITRIRVAGWEESLVFGEAKPAKLE